MVDLSGPLETLDPFGEPWDEQNGTFYITATVYGTGPNDPHGMSDEDRFGQDRRRLEINQKIPKPHSHMTDFELEGWADKFIEDMTNDIKSSQQWRCLFCSKLESRHVESAVLISAQMGLRAPLQRYQCRNLNLPPSYSTGYMFCATQAPAHAAANTSLTRIRYARTLGNQRRTTRVRRSMRSNTPFLVPAPHARTRGHSTRT